MHLARCALWPVALVVCLGCSQPMEPPVADAALQPAPPAPPLENCTVEQCAAWADKLRDLHRPLGKPGPNDWLSRHKEDGQTFAQYAGCGPVTPTGKRTVIYLQPIGEFTPGGRKIVNLTAELLGLWYSRSVVVKEDLPLDIVPATSRRDDQLLTTYVLHNVLKPRLPADAAAYIALTASDLYPGDGWNFVYGQASVSERVGVWSFHRDGKPDGTPEEFRTCLLRTLKTATHEAGHMFTMYHCTKYECGMCGANHRREADGKPLAFCPECDAKVWWATGAEPRARFRRLEEFCAREGFEAEQAFFERSRRALGE